MLEEIQNIKDRKIICLDFDDCLIPWTDFKNGYKNNEESFILKETEKNCKIVRDFIEKTGFEPYITSSWSRVLDENLELKFKDEKIFDDLLAIFKNHFNFIGKDEFNDRVLTIDLLLENGNKVIVVDDFDLSHYFDHLENFKMVNIVNGEGLKEKLEDLK